VVSLSLLADAQGQQASTTTKSKVRKNDFEGNKWKLNEEK